MVNSNDGFISLDSWNPALSDEEFEAANESGSLDYNNHSHEDEQGNDICVLDFVLAGARILNM
ncbi:MAG: hypothetical protein LBC82_07330 [Oscillospiraceae bacterium]|jgi:hypothetical protein|nr:hypothetical protein [Oscillospiraceae bacterium]